MVKLQFYFPTMNHNQSKFSGNFFTLFPNRFDATKTTLILDIMTKMVTNALSIE